MYYLPFILQAIAMFFDEFYFHEKRGLPKWESIGHPLDTLTVVVAYSFLIFFPYNSSTLDTYILLCAFSCLFITKDEFIHSELSPPFENWLHSIMFILHPLSFVCAALLWSKQSGLVFLKFQAIVGALFMMYQILRWNIKWNFSKNKV